jgi:peroxiredoxin Q/BCP
MLPKGARAPEFTLPDQRGAAVSLTSLLNRGPLVLSFLPASPLPLDRRHARALRDLHADLASAGLAVAAITPVARASCEAFARRLELRFPVLSDRDRIVTRMYDLDGPLGIGVRRGTYLVTPGRVVRGAVLSDLSVAAHERFLAEAIAVQACRPRRATPARAALSSAVAAPLPARRSAA